MISLTAIDALLVLLAASLLYKLGLGSRSTSPGTILRGPPSTSYLWGVGGDLRAAKDNTKIYNGWAKEYGAVYTIPTVLGSPRYVVQDPKAIAHVYGGTWGAYHRNALGRRFIDIAFGRGLLWAEGDVARLQRKSLTPAFSGAAIRDYTSVFYDSVYKMAEKWDELLDRQREDGAIIEVQDWMNRVALDTIGLAGFSYDFRTLDGQGSPFDKINWSRGEAWFASLILLGQVIPWVMNLPSEKKRTFYEFREAISTIADHIYAKAKEGDVEDKSIIGALLKAEAQEQGGLKLTKDDVISQMNVLLLAGFETTSTSLTWTLIELSMQPELQARLREELLAEAGTADPTYDQLNTSASLAYLDAVVMETLRLHPPVGQTNYETSEDDVIPLSRPLRTATGEEVDRIFVAKDAKVTVPLGAVNQMPELWGADAAVFDPARWLEGDEGLGRAKEVSGHRHVLTFIDGPRTCLGKQFALTEFKAVLSVLIKTYTFEKMDAGQMFEKCVGASLLPRARSVGAKGFDVPLRVRRVT